MTDEFDPLTLPGVQKKSFAMAYNGGEIWFEHLDGMYGYESLVLEKLERDYATFRRPSATSLIAINIDETDLTAAIAESLCEKLTGAKYFTRVAIVGADRKGRKLLAGMLEKKKRFALAFYSDFEKSKQWLTSEDYT